MATIRRITPAWRSFLLGVTVTTALVVIGISTFLLGASLWSELWSIHHHVEGHLEDGTRYEVYVCEEPYRGSSTSWWGTDGGIPEYVVAKIEVTVGNRLIRLPRTCFEDLAEVRSDSAIVLTRGPDGVCLTLRGGDAGGAYYAHFLPSDTGIRRYVELGELPELVFERARWDNTGNLISREYRNEYLH